MPARRIRIPFPVQGVNRGGPVSNQPSATADRMLNVRPFDVNEKRVRGGQRPGLIKWGAGTRLGDGTNAIASIISVTYQEGD